MLDLLMSVGYAVINNLDFENPGNSDWADMLLNVGAVGYDYWCKTQADEAQRVAELQALAQAQPQQVRTAVAAVVSKVAASKSLEVRQRLATYLTQVPALVRNASRRPTDPTGMTVPSYTHLRKPQDLLPFLPSQLPHFLPGQRPMQGVDLELVEILGIGGFGEVWKARNPLLPNMPPVALKFCLDPTAAKTLCREAAILDRVMRQGKHPGIVELRHTYLSANPPCLEYEYVEGGDLAGLIQEWHQSKGGLSPEQATRLIHHLAEIMAFTHRLTPAIVHRDLKPANILVKRTKDNKLSFRIADFGIGGVATNQIIAKTRLGNTRDLRLTTRLQGSFTPLYASPQQMRGDAPDPRDDIFALGIIWYQLLTGDLTTGAPSGLQWTKPLMQRGMSEQRVRLMASCFEGRAEDRPPNAAILAEKLTNQLKGAGEAKRGTPGKPSQVGGNKDAGETTYFPCPNCLAIVPMDALGTDTLTTCSLCGASLQRPPQRDNANKKKGEGDNNRIQPAAPTATVRPNWLPDIEAQETDRSHKPSSSIKVAKVPLSARARKSAPILLWIGPLVLFFVMVAFFSDIFLRQGSDKTQVRATSANDHLQNGGSDELLGGLKRDVEEYLKLIKAGNDTKKYVAKVGPQRVDIWKTAAENGLLEGQVLFGRCCELGVGVQKDPSQAVKWYRKAADQGFPLAQNLLGHCYREGTGVTTDAVKAVRWYRLAADQGFAPAQRNLGQCYFSSTGVTKDAVEAIRWYRLAAEQGFAPAQSDLAYRYYDGIGVQKDPSLANYWARKAAQQDEPTGQRFLGWCYQMGHGVSKDEVEAVRWHRKAAEQGDADAQRNLGWCYEHGNGVAKNEAEAVNWYHKAAEQNLAVGQACLGYCYLNGIGVKKDPGEGVKWCRMAAEQNDAHGQFSLGTCYENGVGVSESLAEAVKWYRKAADQNLAEGQHNLGHCYENGFGVSKIPAEAVKWYRKAAEQNYPRSQNNLGSCYQNGTGVTKDPVEAVKWYRKAAEQSLAVAQSNLGYCYQHGVGVENDADEAIKWYRKAADQNNANGQNNLGLCYEHAIGVARDDNEAVKWYRKAAEQNHLDAQDNLGHCYQNGRGVAKDLIEAVRWYRKAAEQNNAGAQVNLGVCYENGIGVSKDAKEAVQWYQKAADQGDDIAQYNLGLCYHNGRGVQKALPAAILYYRMASDRGHVDATLALANMYEKGEGVPINQEEANRLKKKAEQQKEANGAR